MNLKTCLNLIFISFLIICNNSILTAQVNYSADTQYINQLNAISLKKIRTHPDSAYLLAEIAIQRSIKINYWKGLGDGYTRMGTIEKNKGNQDAALALHRKALGYREKTGIAEDIGKSFNNIGIIFQLTGIYDSAIYYHLQAIRIGESASDQNNLVDYYNNLGIDFNSNRDFAPALQYYHLSLQIARQLNKQNKIIRATINIGSAHVDLKNYDSALYYLRPVINTPGDASDEQLGHTYNNLGLAYQNKKQIDSAEFCFMKGSEYMKIADVPDLAICLSNLGLLYIEQQQYKKGIQYIHESNLVSFSSGQKDLLATNFQHLATAYFKLEKTDSAYYALEQYIIYNDSVFNENKAEDIEEMRTKFETEKKEQAIVLLNKDNEIQQQQIKKQRLQKNIVIGSSVLSIIIFGLLFNRRQLKRKLEYQQKLEKDRMRISKDLHDDIGGALTSISMYSGVVNEQLKNNQTTDAQNYLSEIAETSRDLITKMGDLVWAINPVNDSFETLVRRVKNDAMRLLQAKNMILHFQADNTLNSLHLLMEARHHLYMILKESITNAAKYSRAQNVWLSISKQQNEIIIEIKDDGTGFDDKAEYEGNGLKNMMHRAEQINAVMDIQSAGQQGTTISIRYHLP